MQIYMKSNLVYDFDRRWTFKIGFMIRTTRSSQEYKQYDENNIGGGGILLAKDKWDKNLLVISFRQRGKAYKSTHFLLYDYWAAELA